MRDEHKTREMLITELRRCRRRSVELEAQVAEKDRVERDLRMSQEWLRYVLESVAESISVTDLEGTLIDLNEAAVRLYGLGSKNEALGANCFSFVAERDRRKAMEDMGTTLECRSTRCLQYTLVKADGSEFIAEISASVLRDGGGDPIGIIAITRDITERNKEEEAVRAREKYFRTLIENSSDAIALVDGDGTILYESPSAERLLGYRPEELVGVNLYELVRPDDMGSVTEVFTHLAASPGEVVTTQLRYRRKDGSWCVLEGVGKNLLHEPHVKGIVVNYRDVTERQRMEDALRQSEQQYRLLAENASDVIWTTDRDLNYTYVSPSVLRLRGYTADEVMRQNAIDTITPRSRETALQYMRQDEAAVAKNGSDLYTSRALDVEFTCRDGSTVWTETRVSFLRDAAGQITGYLGVTRDISDRKRAENALRESEAKYSALVENAKDGVVIVQDGKLKYANAYAAELLGYSIDELLDTDSLNLIAPESRHLVEQRRLLRASGEELPPVVELKVQTKAGAIKEVEISTSAIWYQGRPAVMAMVRDIGERKRTEAERLEHAAAVARAEQLQLSRERIVHLEESLRRDIAQELHGSVQTRLIVVQHRLAELERAASSEELSAELSTLRQELERLVEERIRPISRRLYPSILRQGLIPALQSLCDRFESALPVGLKLDDRLVRREKADRRFIPEEVRLAACRIAEEALVNASKHAKATRAEVRLELLGEGWLELTVSDDGQGFDVERVADGVGLLMMQDYAEVAGGHCTVVGTPGKGTVVAASLPLSTDDARRRDSALALEETSGRLVAVPASGRGALSCR